MVTAGVPLTAGATDAQGTVGEGAAPAADSGTDPQVGEGAAVEDDAQETPIGGGATVEDETPIGEGATVEDEAQIGEGATVEDEVQIGEGATVEDDAKIGEGAEVEDGKVVTLGENLSEEQRASMYEYFGTSADEVETIIVTHADEAKYMEGIATAEQIGPSTNSCAYVEPTESGGIKVKTANLNFVTSAMIASTLTTAGMENCNVIAACPFEVSGTGALTGIIMAYETASGDSLDEGQKEAAMEELMTTGDIADSVGQEKATEVIKDVKTEVIDEGLTDPEEIGEAVDTIAEDNEITLTDEQRDQVVSLMQKISQYDYDVNALKDTLDNLTGETGVLSNIWNSVKTFFVGSDDGILNDTNDEALGTDVITDSTVNEGGFKDGLITRIKNFFSGE